VAALLAESGRFMAGITVALQGFRGGTPLTHRVDRSVDGNTVTFAVSGTVNATRAIDLRSLVDRERGVTVVLDLRDVTVVERDAVPMLAGIGARGTELLNCPEYLRLWMAAERATAAEDVDR
jgi:hypothetical protein